MVVLRTTVSVGCTAVEALSYEVGSYSSVILMAWGQACVFNFKVSYTVVLSTAVMEEIADTSMRNLL